MLGGEDGVARKSPAAASGQEESDEEVVLRMRVDVLKTEHHYLGPGKSSLAARRDRINRRVNPSTKIEFRIRVRPIVSSPW
jgi:hypothetical protein